MGNGTIPFYINVLPKDKCVFAQYTVVTTKGQCSMLKDSML